MSSKSISYILSAAFFLILTGCSSGSGTDAPKEKLTLEEIRSEAEKISEIVQKYENLDLSSTEFYIPKSDKMNGFSLLPIPLSPEEREANLLDTAEWFSGEKPDENNIIYRPYDGDDLYYSEIKDDPDRDENYFVYYKNDSIDIGINIPGNYIYSRKKAVAEIAGREGSYFIDNQEYPKEEYNFLGGIPDADIELQDGVQTLKEIVENMTTVLSGKPFYKIEGLTLCPKDAMIYGVGEKLGVNISFLYEYRGIRLDYHNYGKNIETDKYEGIQTSLTCEASAVWKNGIDELYGAHMFFLSSDGESYDKFIGLDDFLGMMSEKLTGNSKFIIESAELMYGLRNIFPDEYYTAADEERFNIAPVELTAYPLWVGYIPNTGIASAPRMTVVVDAVTGEMNIYG